MSEDPNESDLLIDFNNSVSSRSNALDLKTPSLLPPPCNSAVNTDIRNENNNPFDLAISKTLQHASAANDPFEIVFAKASKALSENLAVSTDIRNENNNPFDFVISKTLQHESAANDPFEVVFEKASKALPESISEDKSNAETTAAPCVNTIIACDHNMNKSKFSSSLAGMDLNLLKEKLATLIVETRNSANCLDALDDNLGTNIMDITDPTGQTMLNLTDVSLQMSFIESQLASAIEESSVCQSSSKVNLLLDSNELNKEILSSGKDSSSDSSFQQSKTTNSKSVEEIKAMVAKRVSICIQNALEDSKRAANMPHRRALSLSSINPVLTKNSSFTNDYCDAAPIKDDVKDLKTELERIKASWKNCSYHKSNNSKNTVLSEAVPIKLALNSTAPVKRLTDVSDLQVSDALASQEPKTLDSKTQKNNEQLRLSPATMGIVYGEALTLSEYFRKLAENCSLDSEDDLLNSTPPWEKCSFVLPEHGSDEDDLQALSCSWQKPNTGDNLDGAKKLAGGSFTKESPVREKPKFQSCPTTPILTSSSTKTDSASTTASELIIAIPPSSDEKKPHLTLRSRLSAILNKNALPSRPELPATPPVPVKVVADEEGKTEIKLRPKRKQAVEKKGPMKAVMPLDNMTRPTSTTKKSAAVKMKPPSQRQPVLSSAPSQGKRSPGYSSRVSSNPPASTPPAAAESGKGKLSSSPGFGFQGTENRRFASPKGGAVSATGQLQVPHSASLPEDNRVSPKSRTVPTLQKPKTNISQIVKPASKTTVSTESQSKPSNTLPQADTSSNVVTSTPVKNQQIPKFQSSPIYHTDNKDKEARVRNTQLNVDGTSTGNAKSTASNQNSKKKLTHARSRSVGSAHSKMEKSPASSENKQGPTVTSGTKASKTTANILKPLAMLKPTNKVTNRMSCSEKAKDDDKTRSTARMMAKMRRSAGASLDKENMNPS